MNRFTSVPQGHLLRGRHGMLLLPRALPLPSDVWGWTRSFMANANFLASANSTVLCFHDWPWQALRHGSVQSSFPSP